jgi:hypothetical protein
MTTTPTPTKPASANKAPANKAVASDKPEIDSRIPAELSEQTILVDFCNRFLGIFDEIAKYNEAVLAEKDAEWTSAKVLEKARELARPTDKNVAPKAEVKTALEAFEEAINALARARKSVLDVTAKELGINLSSSVERNSETEAPLKEKRKLALTIGNQLLSIAEMTTDETASSAVENFLKAYPLPAVGREQVKVFGDTGSSTPKYRVTVTVTNKDGEVVLKKDGFTQTALALVKFYERGKAPKADKLREVWESKGNSAEKPYAVSPVVFEDNGLTYEIAKK